MKKLKEIRQQEIMEHFHKVVAEYGLSGTTLAKVAASIGMNPSLLLHYYKSKEEMLVGFADFIICRYEDFYFKNLNASSEPKERLENLIDGLLVKDIDDVGLVGDRGFYEIYSLSITHPEVKEKFCQFYKRFDQALTKELSILIATGIIKEADANLVSGLLIVLLEGKDFYNNLIEDRHTFKRLQKYLKKIVLQALTNSHNSE